MKFIKYIILILTISAIAQSQRCSEEMLWDGSEPLLRYGMDTTNNWWAITQPFSNKYRLIVNGYETNFYDEIYIPVFSRDSQRWASFGNNNGQAVLMYDDTVVNIPATEFGELRFSPRSDLLAYSYYDAAREIIKFRDQEYISNFRIDRLYISQDSRKLAYIEERGNQYFVMVNGREYGGFDDVKPVGFWRDNKFIYAVKQGYGWLVYKDDEPLSEDYNDIPEIAMNDFGTVLGFSAVTSASTMVAVMYTDEYIEPIVGRDYNSIQNIKLHPELAMITYNADVRGDNVVVFNFTEYAGGNWMGKPNFSWDGELYFMGCNNDCFLNVNGRQHQGLGRFDPDMPLALNYKFKEFAFVDGASMNVRSLTDDMQWSGIMVDETAPARYNRRERRFESLGRIFDRLYLMYCK